MLLLLSATTMKAVLSSYATDSAEGAKKRPFKAVVVESMAPSAPLEPAKTAATAEFDTCDTFKA